MKIHDLLSMALSNLKQRKSRTLLTSIGVMIGCTSIVVMISIGIGLSDSMNQMLENMGDLRMIQIYGRSDGTRLKPSDEAAAGVAGTSAVLVKTAFPDQMMVSAETANGRYKADWAMISGIDPSKYADYGYELIDGSASLTKTGNAYPILVGENFAYNFRDSMRPDGSNMVDRWVFDENGMMSEDKPDPWFDPMKQTLTLNISNPEDPNASPFSVTLKPVGILKEDYQIGAETSDGFMMSEKDIDEISREAAARFGIKNPEKNISQIQVMAESIEQVEEVENELKNQKFMTSSMKSIRDQIEGQSRMTQLVLGGIGAISLIVAAIGITNTMIMSVSERTREIGIMKALGCRTSDIRTMFLTESGLIGLLGGISGLILSFLISLGINYAGFSANPEAESFWTYLMTPGNRTSVIPVWLAVFALIFSVGIGVFSGMIPANRSVKISALEAIRRE